ncbi:hypothetical protein B1R32_10699 [Abditibacterium utsteinense]|uniref:Uncharacterized protein n=1 Tax=Abditibacterium utsteinense TaxID=1960156 RepID=A0A2S8STW8_9BACT|nr:hypothetical protein [Abditibacterium utsteinense]PQV64253.1 hypothetical protein B1R32_10699 [Abditibacterium utsteinense]
MKFACRPGAVAFAVLLTYAVCAPKGRAQNLIAPTGALKNAPGDTPSGAPATRLGEGVRERVLRGRAQFEAGDENAVVTLRDAAQSALVALTQVAGQNPLDTGLKALPNDAVTAGLSRTAGEAHFYWGLAADRFARRDESITALSRALRLSRALAPSQSGDLRRDAALELGRVLRGGLPLVAPDDALETIAQIAHGGLWTPKRLSFDTLISTQIGGAPLGKTEFLITDGKLFPPIAPISGDLSRTPPFYANVPDSQLPGSLHLDKMVAGYERQTSGPNRGQWRQIARVFYASPFLTKDKRDDLPRARALCEQFLKVHTLFQNGLGATNLYTRGDRDEGVTTLWLLEVSALWPEDDDDPAVLAQLGARMPNVNTGALRQATEPVTTPIVRPWMALAGQMESNAGEIMFWKASLKRPETEWAREVFHEYGHVALPPFGGFRPPLEPYGNGVLGETLGALWAAPQPERFGAPSRAANDFTTHVNNQALPALQFFLGAGPNSPFKTAANRDGWRYLQGLTVYLERVYGPTMLGRALTPLSNRAAGVSNIAARRSLMNGRTLCDALDFNWRGWSGKTLPIWLPGALYLPRNAQNLIARDGALLPRGSKTNALLYVPTGAQSLRIEGAGTSQMRAVGLPFERSAGAMRIYFGGRSGWQSFTLVAGANTAITSARFEKK